MKFLGRQDCLESLGARIGSSPRLAALAGGARQPLVVPVPLDRRTLRRRGYNQAEGLARGLADALGLPLEARGLVRRRAGRPQAMASGRSRRLGARAAFRARPACLAGRAVLLVDDVLSTGATADAAARAALCAGAADVRVATLAT